MTVVSGTSVAEASTITEVTPSADSTATVAGGTEVVLTTTSGRRPTAASAAATVAESRDAPASNDTATADPRTPMALATAAAVVARSTPVSRTTLVTPSLRSCATTASDTWAVEPTT